MTPAQWLLRKGMVFRERKECATSGDQYGGGRGRDREREGRREVVEGGREGEHMLAWALLYLQIMNVLSLYHCL